MDTDVRGRTYAPKGQTVIAFTPGAPSQTVDYFNGNQPEQGALDDHGRHSTLTEFFVVLDNLRVHHSKILKASLLEALR